MNFTQIRFASIFKCLQLSLAVLILSSTVFAAGEIDPTFNAAVQETTRGYVLTVVQQTDGKLLVGGNFAVAGNSGRSNVARLNADGTVDPTFAPPDFYRLIGGGQGAVIARDINVYAVAQQADGKILVGGDFYQVGNQVRPGLARLNADGSLDTVAFLSAASGQPIVYDIKIQADGKILASGNFGIFRFNADGTRDTTFSGNFATVRSFVIQPDGKIVYANSGGIFGTVRRVNADGSADNSFLEASVNNSNNNPVIYKVALQADGKILVGGIFGLTGSPLKNVIRLNPNGALDPDFNIGGSGTGDFGEVRDLEILTDGKIVIGGSFAFYNNVSRVKTARLNSNGTLDTTFNYNPGNNATVYAVAALNDGGFIFGGLGDIFQAQPWDKLTRFNANGTLDANFRGAVYDRGIVYKVAAGADGKIVVGGLFRKVNGAARQNVARLNADGSIDAGFVSNAAGGAVFGVASQADGKVLIGGAFTQVGGISRSYVARLNNDGSLDTTFQTTLTTGTVDEIIVLPTGKILIAGNFRVPNYNFVLNVARLNADGSVDQTFQQSPVNNSGLVLAMKVQADGKIVVAGDFSQIAGANRGRVARLNADGTLDTTFSLTAAPDNIVYDLAVQSNGSIVIGGAFLSVNGGASGTSPYVERLLPDGTTDPNFPAAANNIVYAVERQADDKILLGGIFSQINGGSRFGIARLNANGTFDNSFVGPGTNDSVRSIAVQPDNRILIGGEFNRAQNSSNVVGVARLLNAPSVARTPFDFDGDGKADVSLFRPSNGTWYILPSGAGGFYGFPFGQAGDQIAPADYDGDGKTDVAVFRETVPGAGDQAYFYILNSADNSFRAVGFGTQGDQPVSGDWDGDGKADLAVYRVATAAGGQSRFFYRPSSQPTVNFNTIVLGTQGDKPLVGDFDGDGKIDAAVFRASAARFEIIRTSNGGFQAVNFGVSTDIPVPADYDGDGITNIAVFRPSNGTWYTNQNPATNFGAIVFGASGDLPVPADYDGDGRADVGVFRPSNGAWFINRTTSGLFGVQFGANGDKPAPNAYIR